MSADKTIFREWLRAKYRAWRGDAIGNERSITEFAAWLGVSQPAVSSWMSPNGKVPSSEKTIKALVKRFGSEVYDVIGSEDPVPWTRLPAKMRRRFEAAFEEWNDAVATNNLDPESEEATRLATEIFKKHGLEITPTDTE